MSRYYEPATAPRPQVLSRRGAVRHAAIDRPAPRLAVMGHMLAEDGERDERCGKYSACLAAHVAAHKRSDPPASCPQPCRFREAVVERATDYASAGGHRL